MNTYWQRKANFRTYELNPELIRKINSISQEFDVYQSELVRALLHDALKRVETGELKLKPVPKSVKHRLHELSVEPY
jgi:hypothetical protein